MYNTAFAGMSGEQPFKKIKKPSDLYRLSMDNTNLKPISIDMDKAREGVELMKKHFKWEKESDLIKTN